jgi:hypothetical protein
MAAAILDRRPNVSEDLADFWALVAFGSRRFLSWPIDCDHRGYSSTGYCAEFIRLMELASALPKREPHVDRLTSGPTA